MALDKLVDSTQLDTDLTSVADAIRTKGGTSGQLQFPGGFVDAIDAIETGGGGSELTLLASGEYVKTSSSSSLSIPVSYSGTPRLFYAYVETPLDATGQTVLGACFLVNDPAIDPYTDNTGKIWFYAGRGTNNAYSYSSGTRLVIPSLTSSTATFFRANAAWNYQANTYKWYIYGEAST